MYRTHATKAILALVPLVGFLMLTSCGDRAVREVPPATPTGLTAEPGDGLVTLTWNANTEATLLGYNVLWDVDADDLTESRFVAAPALITTIDDLTNGVEYHFAIDAESVSGLRSAPSATVTAVPVASGVVPPVVTATHPLDGAIDVDRTTNVRVTFSKPMDLAATEAAFAVEPAVACTFGWNAAATVMTCVPDALLASDTAHTVMVAASARAGDGSQLETPASFTFTTGTRVLEACVFDVSVFDDCVFGP